MSRDAWPVNPYEAPKADLTEYAELPSDSGSRSFRRDPSRLTATLKALLWASLAVHTLSLGSSWASHALLTGGMITDEAVDAMNAREGVLNLVQIVVVLVTAPDASVVVVSTELNTDSTPFCMPPKMPSCPAAGVGSRASDPITASDSAAEARPNYRSPMIDTQ